MAPKEIPPSGPLNARIMIVGEAPSRTDAEYGIPFCGSSGNELTRMLAEAGIDRNHCFLTNVARIRAPDNDPKNFFLTKTAAKKAGIEEYLGAYPDKPLYEGCVKLAAEIAQVQPEIIIALGDTALWALTGELGISKWRGSMLYSLHKRSDGTHYKVVPTYHPSRIMKKWEWRTIAVHDFRSRVVPYINKDPWPIPDYNFIVRPYFKETISILNKLLSILEKTDEKVKLAVDTETSKLKIACIGIAWSKKDAICIPFQCIDEPYSYWTEAEEIEIILLLKKILTHKNAYIIGQNFNYDRQYIARNWGFKSRLDFDTQTAQHTAFPLLLKGLDFISSMYCEYHRYWKDEGKEFHEGIKTHLEEDQYWTYNCKDCCATFEAAEVLDDVIDQMQVRQPFNIQMRLNHATLKMVLRGTRFDLKLREKIGVKLFHMMQERIQWFEQAIGPSVGKNTGKPWYNSPAQTARLFYEWMGIKPVLKKGKPTTEDSALAIIGLREPLAKPITDRLAEYRSLGVFYRTFIQAKIDKDGRVRCQLKVDGTSTFRFASSKDAFDFGMNLQNISAGSED